MEDSEGKDKDMRLGIIKDKQERAGIEKDKGKKKVIFKEIRDKMRKYRSR